MTESSIHLGLRHQSRLGLGQGHGQTDRGTVTDVTLLLAAGCVAACATMFLDLRLRIPGHAILRAMIPMALGLAVAPRRFGGLTMGLSAAATVGLAGVLGVGRPGAGAVTSLIALGPCLDVALIGAREGWRLYLSFMAAGATANLLAFLARGVAKFGGLEKATARPLATWWSHAMITYILCGILAGLLSALICFRIRSTPGSCLSGDGE